MLEQIGPTFLMKEVPAPSNGLQESGPILCVSQVSRIDCIWHDGSMAPGFALGDTDADAWLLDWNIWIGQVVCRSDMPLEALGGVSGWIDECS